MSKERFFPVEFGSFSQGNAASIGVTIPREETRTPEKIDEILCHKRLDLTIRVTPEDGEGINQRKIPGTDEAYPEISATVDVKGYRTNASAFSTRLSFNIDELNGHDLREFVKKHGLLIIRKVSEIPAPVKAGSSPVKGQQEFDDHPDTGPRPRRGRKTAFDGDE